METIIYLTVIVIIVIIIIIIVIIPIQIVTILQIPIIHIHIPIIHIHIQILIILIILLTFKHFLQILDLADSVRQQLVKKLNVILFCVFYLIFPNIFRNLHFFYYYQLLVLPLNNTFNPIYFVNQKLLIFLYAIHSPT